MRTDKKWIVFNNISELQQNNSEAQTIILTIVYVTECYRFFEFDNEVAS